MKLEIPRDAEAERLFSLCRSGSWCGVIGAPLMGKSVLAKQLYSHITTSNYGWDASLVRFEYAGTLNDAWSQIAEAAGLKPIGLSAGRTLAPLIREQFASRKVVLILDNIEALPDQVLRSLAAEFRRVRNHSSYRDVSRRLCLVIVGSTKLYDLAGPESPLANTLEILPIGGLSFAEVRAALGRVSEPDAISDCIEELYTQTGGHPYHQV